MCVCSVHEHKQEYTALMSPNRAKRPQCRLQFSFVCVCVVCVCVCLHGLAHPLILSCVPDCQVHEEEGQGDCGLTMVTLHYMIVYFKIIIIYTNMNT